MIENKRRYEFKNAEIRLAAMDLDDTLVRADKSISEYTKSVLKSCKGYGIMTAIATTRFLISIQKEQEILNTDIQIVANGAMILRKGELLDFKGMGLEETNDVLASLKNAGAGKIYAGCKSKVYTDDSGCMKSRTLHKALPYDFKQHLKEEACLIFFHLDEEEKFRKIKEKFPDLQWNIYRDGTFSVTAQEVSKGKALQKVSEIYGISQEKIAAFGDDEADCEMLSWCKVGVAVENAVPNAIHAASYITRSNEQDGVAWFLEQYLKEKYYG